jgi:hypothetical protein
MVNKQCPCFPGTRIGINCRSMTYAVDGMQTLCVKDKVRQMQKHLHPSSGCRDIADKVGGHHTILSMVLKMYHFC